MAGTGGLLSPLVGLLALAVMVMAADKVVEKMEAVAKYYGVSEIVIAMTVISVATSLPELSLHLVGSAKIMFSTEQLLSHILGDPVQFMLGEHSQVLSGEAAESFRNVSATVLGGNIGSNIVQQTLIFGSVLISAAFIAEKKSFRFSKKVLVRDYLPMMGVHLVTLVLALDWLGLLTLLSSGSAALGGTLTRIDGLVLLGLFVAYTWYLYSTRKEELLEQGASQPSSRPRVDLLTGLLSMALVLGSAEVFLRSLETIIESTGLSGSMIGVVAVGVASALPELTTAVSGLRHGSEGISLGTLIGSNITNPLLAIGAGAAVSSYAVPDPLVLLDLPVEILTATTLLVYMFNKERIGDILAPGFRSLRMEGIARRMDRTEDGMVSIGGAALLVLLYFVYVYVRFTYFPVDFA